MRYVERKRVMQSRLLLLFAVIILLLICSKKPNDATEQPGEPVPPDTSETSEEPVPPDTSATLPYIRVPQDYQSIQAAIDAAQHGDSILVDAGVYRENINFNGKNISLIGHIEFQADSSYEIKTILQGDPFHTVVTFDSGEDSTALLRGFIIRGGGSTGPGGVLCAGTSPRLSYVHFLDNKPDRGSGGALYAEYSRLKMDHIIAGGNYASNGGALNFNFCPDVVIHHAVIENNWTEEEGGGIYIESSNVRIANAIVRKNRCNGWRMGGIGSGGGIHVASHTTPKTLILQNCLIADNSASADGGGLYVMSNTVHLHNTVIKGNRAMDGGGIACDDHAGIWPELVFDANDRCSIYNNSAAVGWDLHGLRGHVVLDTFTVRIPTEQYIYPLADVTLDIQHAIEPEDKDFDLYVSPQGDDSNSGASWERPLKSITHALTTIRADAQNPHTIYLSAGTFSEEATGEKFPLSMKNYVSLKGSNMHTTFILGDNWRNILQCVRIRDVSVSDVTLHNGLSGLYIDAEEGANIMVRNVIAKYNRDNGIDCENVSLDNVWTLRNNTGIRARQSQLLHIKSYDNTYSGLNISPKLSFVKNSLFFNNGPGIQCSGEGEIEMINISVIAGAHGGGLYIDWGTDVRLVNSILWEGVYSYVHCGGGDFGEIRAYATIDYCDIQNGRDGFQRHQDCNNITWGDNILDADPLFVDPSNHDYHLRDSSPCRQAGHPDADFNNVDGTRNDLGAYGGPLGEW